MSRPPTKQIRQRHGLKVLRTALSSVERRHGSVWLERLDSNVGGALREWRAAIVADLGGEDSISAQERVVIDAATTTYLLLSSVDKFLLEQESVVNKSRRKLFPVVLERQRLADALVRYLETLGLRRRVSEPPDISRYIAERYKRNEREESIAADSGEATNAQDGAQPLPPESEDQ